jgi:hypothetical protein
MNPVFVGRAPARHSAPPLRSAIQVLGDEEKLGKAVSIIRSVQIDMT